MGINIEIEKKTGEFSLSVHHKTEKRRIGILGASGCGKSMTLQCIAGITTPDQGVIEVDGRNVYDSAQRTNSKIKERKVGYLFQDYALFPTMSVRENIMAGIHLPKKERRERADEYICKFSLEGLAKHLPGELSGGQRQRTAMARMLANEPEVILLDEPFSALDSHLKERMQLELEYILKDYKGIVVLVSHSRDEMYRFTEELIVLEHGKQVEAGETKEIFAHPKTKEAARLTGCKNISRVEWVDEKTILATDWNLILKTENMKDTIQHVGIRAHEIRVIQEFQEDMENVVELPIIHVTKLPFEVQYLIGMEEKSNCLVWKAGRQQDDVCREAGERVRVCLPKKKLLLLE